MFGGGSKATVFWSVSSSGSLGRRPWAPPKVMRVHPLAGSSEPAETDPPLDVCARCGTENRSLSANAHTARAGGWQGTRSSERFADLFGTPNITDPARVMDEIPSAAR